MVSKLLPHIIDIVELSATALKEKYPIEYNSWRNMKGRRKDGFIVADEFETFDGFLAMMGPVPESNFTIDRIDYTDKEYAPGKCRWADKKTQTENRKSTVFITHAGTVRSLTGWADATSQKVSTLRSRYNKNLSHDEIILGKGNATSNPRVVSSQRSRKPSSRFESRERRNTVLNRLKAWLRKNDLWCGEYKVVSVDEVIRQGINQYKSMIDTSGRIGQTIIKKQLNLPLDEGIPIDELPRWLIEENNKSSSELLSEYNATNVRIGELRKLLKEVNKEFDDSRLQDALDPPDDENPY